MWLIERPARATVRSVMKLRTPARLQRQFIAQHQFARGATSERKR